MPARKADSVLEFGFLFSSWCQMVLFVAVWCCMVQKLATFNLLCFWATNLLLEQHLGNKYTRKKGIGQQIREEFYFLTIRKTSG